MGHLLVVVHVLLLPFISIMRVVGDVHFDRGQYSIGISIGNWCLQFGQ